MKEGVKVTLKRKESDDDEAIDTKEPKRLLTNLPVRSRINTNQDLWKGMSILRQDCRTSGIIPKLEPNLKSDETQYAFLCSPYTDYISTGLMDLGWGCGYRNCQMLMSFLERHEEEGECLLKCVPDISSIQLLIENAWKEGFDPLGAKQLKNHVFKTRKWIGTTEVYTLLAYLGIRSTIIDFHQPGPERLHKDMFDWIQSYFTTEIETKKGRKVYITHRPPLYLQHQGHSRTVIGIEILKSGKRNLIIFDPGRRMLRSFRKRVNYNEESDSSSSSSEISSSSSSSSSSEEEEEEEEEIDIMNDHHQPKTLRQRLLTKLKKSNRTKSNTSSSASSTSSASSLFYPFRVDDKTIAKHRQYQILVLGQVVYHQGKMHWDEKKGYLLNEDEREAMKNVTSLAVM
ncbi:DUF1671-domain-containing protein [Rhizopus microsporus var. microsporus]|nr:DUF1671-domain-containing protein [Rhizopus microsporus var. microsporus]